LVEFCPLSFLHRFAFVLPGSHVAWTHQTHQHSPNAIFEKNVTRLAKFARVICESLKFGTISHCFEDFDIPFFFLLGFGLSQLTSLQFIQYHVAGFYTPTIHKVHPTICGITAHATMPG
jgi:hypothetical protein